MSLHIEVSKPALKALEVGRKEPHEKEVAAIKATGVGKVRVQLPLIKSLKPGTLRSLTNEEIDGLDG